MAKVKEEIPFELGCTVKDRVTGFTGTAVGLTIWLNGCVRVVVESPTPKDGKPHDPASFDIQQIAITAPAPDWVNQTPALRAVRELISNLSPDPGGPMPTPKQF